MNSYSKALRHISIKDVKQKHQQKLAEQKNQKRIEREERKYIQSVMETKKYEWRKEIKIVEEQVEEVVEDLIDKEYDWREQLEKDKKKYFEEGMTSSGMFFTTLPAVGDVDLLSPPLNNVSSYNGSIVGGTVILSGDPSPSPSNGAILSFDARQYDTLKFNVNIPSGAMLGFLDISGGESQINVLLIVYASGTYTLTIPSNLRTSNFQLVLDTPDSATMSVSNFTFQRRTPMNVFVSLDSPEASAFIRTDPIMANLSPQERLQKLKEMLEASDEYVMKIFGGKFPGTGAVPPGESGDIPGVEITDYQPSGYMNIKGGGQEITKTYPKTQPTQSKPSINSGRADPSAIAKALNIPFADAVRAADRINANQPQSTIKSFNNIVQGKEPAFAVGYIEGLNSAKQSEVLKALGPKASATFNQIQQYKELNKKLSQSKNPADWDRAEQVSGSIQQLYDKFGKEMRGEISKPSSTPPTPPKLPSPPKPQLDKYGRQIGTPLPPGVQQDMEKGGKTASPVGNAAIMAAAAALLKAGFKGGSVGAETGSQLPARGSAEWQRMAKEYTRANPGQYNPFMTNAQNQLMQKYGVGRNAMPLRSLKNSYEPEGQVILEKRKLKSPQEILNKIPGYYDGKPAPLGFPETPPPKMVNGMHPDLVDGKNVANRFNRLDPESAKATPLTGNPHIDKKIKSARKKPK